MILPKKHILLAESYYGFGGYLLSKLKDPIDIDSLWQLYQQDLEAKRYPVSFSFDKFVLALDFLYMVGAIVLNSQGDLCYASVKA